MAKKQDSRTLFRRLTRLFRSGPIVRRKIRGLDTAIAVPDKTKSSGTLLFQKSLAPTYATITAQAYNLSERLMRYNDFQEMEYCLLGRTIIPMPGGSKTLAELAEECDADPDKTFVVYAYDHENKRLVPAVARQARMTRVDQAWKVTFDNGQEIIGSANHRLMLRDGTYCKIEDLEPGMSMMPFYRKDLFENAKRGTKGYRWVYTMDSRFRGWIKEHQLIAEWVLGRPLNDDEVVHHENFVKQDNRPENLRVMTKSEHSSLHANINNQHKWSEANRDWIEQFKREHSRWMKENNPVERKDVTFGRILETCERVGFNLPRLSSALDADFNVIKRRLVAHGFKNFETFAAAYVSGWRNGGWNNKGQKNPRYDHGLTYEDVCSAFEPKSNMTLRRLAEKLNTTQTKVFNRIKHNGFKTWAEFKAYNRNHKVVSVEYYGVEPLYDMTVDGYKNFATDSVVSHNTPEIAAALDIYADEACSQDDKGRSLHIFSDNERIKEILEDLFYNVLNVEFNLRSWIRNLCKYGDFFLYNDVSPEYGVVNAFPIPVNEIEREENFDREDPFAVRYRWVTLGNRTLENWEVSHFRLLGNDLFLPYGSSIIEPARRIWRQLILIEDAMLVYRVVRAPERRVFYIDVANVAPENVENYVTEQKTQLRSQQVVDGDTGRVDLRYNPLSVDEDYFIPVRGSDTGTRIDTLAAGQNTGTVEDVEYIQKKLFASLKIPRAYLGYEEMLSSKATLAQEDIRFSRTIAAIQKVVIAELNKIAIIHLFANGYTDEDLINFTLRLSNPSTVAQQQKLEIWRAKFDIASTMPEGMGSRRFAYKNIWALTDKEIKEIEEDRWREKAIDVALEAVGEGGEEPGGGGGGGADLFGGGGGGDLGGGGEDIFGGEGGGEGDMDLGGGEEEEPPPEENAGEEEPEDEEEELELLTSVDDSDDDERFGLATDESDSPPIKPKSDVRKDIEYRNSRRQTLGKGGTYATHTPDLYDMATNDESSEDPYDSEWLRSVVSNPFGESRQRLREDGGVRLPVDVESALRGMVKRFGPASMTDVLTEVIERDEGEQLELDLEHLTEAWHDEDEDVDIVIVEGSDDEWSEDDE